MGGWDLLLVASVHTHFRHPIGYAGLRISCQAAVDRDERRGSVDPWKRSCPVMIVERQLTSNHANRRSGRLSRAGFSRKLRFGVGIWIGTNRTWLERKSRSSPMRRSVRPSRVALGPTPNSSRDWVLVDFNLTTTSCLQATSDQREHSRHRDKILDSIARNLLHCSITGIPPSCRSQGDSFSQLVHVRPRLAKHRYNQTLLFHPS